MSRLRNRMVKAEFWTDPDLLSWSRDKRFFYMGLRAAAEDSGCIEDSPFGWMVVLYPSPLDRDISIEQVTAWRDELIADGKLVPYSVGGKNYLYQSTFHDHEHPRNPQDPNLPLPPWVRWVRSSADTRKGQYEVSKEDVPQPETTPCSVVQPLYKRCTTVVQPLYNGCTSVVQASPPRPAPPRPAPFFNPLAIEGIASKYTEDFEEWWEAYGRRGNKADAAKLWTHWTKHGATVPDLLTAARNYITDCERRDRLIADGRTFLARNPNRWAEWVIPHPAELPTDRRTMGNLHDVLEAGAQAFGLTTGEDHHAALGQGKPDRPKRTVESHTDAVGGVPASRLETGQ